MTKFVYGEEDVKGLQVFENEEDALDAQRDETLDAAKQRGFDTVVEQPESFLCGKAGTAELVECYLDGTWEYRDATTDETKTQTGADAQTLGWYLDDLNNPAEAPTADKPRKPKNYIHIHYDK